MSGRECASPPRVNRAEDLLAGARRPTVVALIPGRRKATDAVLREMNVVGLPSFPAD